MTKKSKILLSVALIYVVCFLFLLALVLPYTGPEKLAFADDFQRDDFQIEELQRDEFQIDDSQREASSSVRSVVTNSDGIVKDNLILDNTFDLDQWNRSNATILRYSHPLSFKTSATWGSVNYNLSNPTAYQSSVLTFSIYAKSDGNALIDLRYVDANHSSTSTGSPQYFNSTSYVLVTYTIDLSTISFTNLSALRCVIYGRYANTTIDVQWAKCEVSSTFTGFVPKSYLNYGYNQGSADGYSDGYSLGFDDGYDEGYDTGFDSGRNVGYIEGFNNGLYATLNYENTFYSPVSTVPIQSSNLYSIPGTALKYLPVTGVSSSNTRAYTLKSNVGYSSIFTGDYYTVWQSILNTNVVPFLKSAYFLFHSDSPGDFLYVYAELCNEYEVYFNSPTHWTSSDYGTISIYFWKDSDHSLSKRILEVNIYPDVTEFLFQRLYDFDTGDLVLEKWLVDFNADRSPDLLKFSVSFGLYDNQQIYSSGVQDGIDQANSTINTASASYAAGYNAGSSSAQHMTFDTLMGAVIDVPIKTIGGLLDFNFLGINLLQFIYSLLTLGIIIAIIRLFLGKS